MFNRVQSKSKAEKVSNIRPTKAAPEGRARLKHVDDQIALANAAVAELEQRIQRCEQIIQSAGENRHALQAAVEADNGSSLADFSAGLVPDDSAIARLVRASENSGMAANAAKASLPTAQAQLENARAQVVELGEQRAAELKRVIAMLADIDAMEYQKTFDRLVFLHDQLCGYARIAEDNQGDVRLVQEFLKAPRFALPSMGSADADPFLRSRESDLTVRESARFWSAVQARLIGDANASIDDLWESR